MSNSEGFKTKSKRRPPRYVPDDPVGPYIVLDILYYDTGASKPAWRYSVRCMNCGAEHERLQHALVVADSSESEHCKECAPAYRGEQKSAGIAPKLADLEELNDESDDLIPDFATIPVPGALL